MNTQQLIKDITQSPTPRRPLALGRIITEWLVVSAIAFMAIILITSLRDDIQQQLANPWFLAEISTNFILFLASGVAAIYVAYPDRKPSIPLRFVGAALLLYLSFILGKIFLSAPPAALPHDHPHSIECLACILSFAFTPALFLFIRLKQLATTHPAIMGATAFLSATALGTIGVLFVENENTHSGLIIWHYAPLALIFLLGYVAGKKIFKW